ncbi:MAG: DUF2130 domain-containing protein [bacterium]
MEKQVIVCPKCSTEIDVNAVLYQNISKELEKEFIAKTDKSQQELDIKIAEIKKTEESLKKQSLDLDERISAGVSEKLKSEKIKIENDLRTKLTEENSDELKALQEELNRKSGQLKEFNQAKAEIERLKREKEELSSAISLEKEKEFTEKLNQERKRLSEQYQDENYLKLEEYKKTVDDLTKQIAEVKRQAEQGSVQMQGEIQELVIENELRAIYPLDIIDEIKKGQAGADILQTVVSNTGDCCGKIYYESKRTKEFNLNWIDKLKSDNLAVNADVLVIVSEILPEGINTFFFKDGVYIVSFKEFKTISFILRNFLIKIAENNISNSNKGTKEALLYNYLTSNEFKSQFEVITNSFVSLKDSLYKEKLRSEKVFKEREKQIDNILVNMIGFHGSIKGIAGASISDVLLIEETASLTF